MGQLTEGSPAPGPLQPTGFADAPNLLPHPRCWDIVFDDGTAMPFSIAIDKRQLDRTLTAGRGVLTVWVPTGKTLELPIEICV